MDFADAATAHTSNVERAALKRARRDQGMFLGIALNRDGSFRVASATSVSGAILEIPDDLLDEGFWLVASHKQGNWSVVRHQFSCLSELAMLQLACFIGERWLRSVEDCVSRHPANHRVRSGG